MFKKLLYLLILLPALSFAQLGDYYYSNNDSNEKGLDFQIKIPLGFEEKEPSRPGIVKMWEIPFGKPGGYVSIGIVVVERPKTDNASKDALINAFKNKDFLKEYISVANKQLKSFSDYKYYVIDNNPGFIFEGTQDWEGGEIKFELHIQSANVYTESHIFQLSLTASRQELLNDNKSLFSRMANSIVFPEQWKQLGYIELPSDNLKLDEMNPQLTADIITNKFSGFKEKSFWGNDNLSVTIEPYSVDIDQITSSYLSNLIYDEERYNLVEFSQMDAKETFGIDEQGNLLVGIYKKNNYLVTKLPVLVDYGYSSYVFDIIIKVLNTDKDIIDTKYIDSDIVYVEKTAKMLSMIIPLLKDYIKIPQILTEQQMSELTKNYLDNYIKEKGEFEYNPFLRSPNRPSFFLRPLYFEAPDKELEAVYELFEQDDIIVKEMKLIEDDSEKSERFEVLVKKRKEIYIECEEILVNYVESNRNIRGAELLQYVYIILRNKEGQEKMEKLIESLK